MAEEEYTSGSESDISGAFGAMVLPKEERILTVYRVLDRDVPWDQGP